MANQEILFYNQATGAGATGTITSGGQTVDFTTKRTYPVGAFRTGWTHIVRWGDSALFYNSADGSAAIGFDPTVESFPAGSFAVGWTHVAWALQIVIT